MIAYRSSTFTSIVRSSVLPALVTILHATLYQVLAVPPDSQKVTTPALSDCACGATVSSVIPVGTVIVYELIVSLVASQSDQSKAKSNVASSSFLYVIESPYKAFIAVVRADIWSEVRTAL